MESAPIQSPMLQPRGRCLISKKTIPSGVNFTSCTPWHVWRDLPHLHDGRQDAPCGGYRLPDRFTTEWLRVGGLLQDRYRAPRKLQSLGAKCREPSSCSLALSKLTGTVRAIALCHTGIADCTSSVTPDEHCGGRLAPMSDRTAIERDTIRVDYPDSSSRPSRGNVTLQDSNAYTPDNGTCMSGDSCF